MPRPGPSPLARALGRIPTGIYIVTTLRSGAPVGFVGSLVQQVAFDPPTVVLAVGTDREQLLDLRAAGRFALSILGEADQALMSQFLKRLPPEASPFDGLELVRTKSGLPVLAGALAWLDCRIAGERASGDHVVLFGEVEDGALLRDEEPRVHLRRNGLGY